MELRSKKGFVVNTLTTANQRARSSGSSTSGLSTIVQKLVGQPKMSAGATGVSTPMAEQTAIMTSMLKINNLTDESEVLG
jgi:hypothetical protein